MDPRRQSYVHNLLQGLLTRDRFDFMRIEAHAEGAGCENWFFLDISQQNVQLFVVIIMRNMALFGHILYFKKIWKIN